jgi:hypothetical protein
MFTAKTALEEIMERSETTGLSGAATAAGHRSLMGIPAVALLLWASGAAGSFAGFQPADEGPEFPSESNGRVTAIPFINAQALGSEPIRLDGRLDEPVWRRAQPGSGFRVWDPDRGALPSEETVFKAAYGEDAVYFAVACLEKDPSKISSSLSRRDSFNNSDLVSIYIDPYFDRTTGYNFRVNPHGVQQDSYMYNDGDRDQDWDAVWEAETYRDDEGWYIEMKIPFSSIRYRPADSMTWGLQVYRYMHGRGEDTAWVTWDRETRGFISRFGELRGLSNVVPPRQLEIVPYFVQRSTDPSLAGPGDEIENFENLGADVKYGVTADLTLNATIQPDFGQVESDPAVLNLSPFETFFTEKRPFFIEGNRFFEHPDFTLFYSRRIGTGDANSRIRFAGKLTGKTAGDVSVAALYAATDVARDGRAHNPLDSGERLSHYFVGRFGKEFNEGNHRFNVMQTLVSNRADRETYGDAASREAYTTGADFDLNFHNRDYNVQGSFVGSMIASEAPAGETRPGILYGTGGALDVRRLGGNVNGGIYGRWEGDRLRLNDLGFLSSPDAVSAGAWASYNYNPEGRSRLFNRANVNYNYWQNWLYAARSGEDALTGEVAWTYGRGHRERLGTNFNGWMQFRNYMEAWWGIEYIPEGTQRYETRGGPLIDEPTTYGGWGGAQTDSRKDVLVWVEGSYFADVADNLSYNVDLGLVLKQSSAVHHRLELGYNERLDDTQYLETVDLAERPGGVGIGGRSYVFGEIHQKTLDLTLRTNLLVSRNTSLEIYAQPFIAVGDYTRARELATPDSYDLVSYGEPGYRVEDNDFSFTAANLNAVFRWEYRPGSALFLVWTHSRSTYDERSLSSDPARFKNEIDSEDLFTNEPENVFMAKVTYWFAI